MRKVTTFIILFFALLISCSKKDPVDSPNDLVSTSWTHRGDKGDILTIKIADKEKANLVVGNGDDIYSEYPGTYVYNKPTVSLKFQGDVILNGEGTVKGNKMQLTLFTDDNKMELTFIKDGK